MSSDFQATLQRLKAQKRVAPLSRRSENELAFVGDHVVAGPDLPLDTTIYIDTLQGCAPPEVQRLLATRQVNH